MCEPHSGNIESKAARDEGWNPDQLTVRLWANYTSILWPHYLSINGDKIITTPSDSHYKIKRQIQTYSTHNVSTVSRARWMFAIIMTC